MKVLKRITSILLAVVMMFGITQAAMPVTAEAKSNKSAGVKDYPDKVRIFTGSSYNEAITITLTSSDYELKSVKSSSKDLKAKVTYNSSTYQKSDGSVREDKAEGRIGLYTKKEGTYKVTVTIGKKSDEKFAKTLSVKVYAKNDSPFKKVTIGGKDAYEWKNRYYFSQKTLAFKAQEASGYKIKKVEVGTYKKVKTEDENYRTELTWKTIKNGGKFKLSSQKNEYKSRYYFWGSVAAETCVRVTYTDKYTKQPATQTFSFYYIKM